MAHLNPLRKHVVILVYLIREFGDILVAFLPHLIAFAPFGESVCLMNHAVDERRNTVYERNFSPLFQIAFLVFFDVQTGYVQFILNLLLLIF